MEIQIAHVVAAAFVGILAGIVGGWAVGRAYQRRREDGKSQEEIVAAEKAKAVAAVMPYLQLLKRELEEIKAKVSK